MRIFSLRSNWRIYATLTGALLIIYAVLAIFFPSWFSSNSKSILTAVFEFSGLAILPFGIWIVALLIFLRYRPARSVSNWRYILLSLMLCVSSFGIMTQFETNLPYSVGLVSFGGSIGIEIFGPNMFYGFAVSILIAILGFWIGFPRLGNRLAKLVLKRSALSLKWLTPRFITGIRVASYYFAIALTRLIFQFYKAMGALYIFIKKTFTPEERPADSYIEPEKEAPTHLADDTHLDSKTDTNLAFSKSSSELTQLGEEIDSLNGSSAHKQNQETSGTRNSNVESSSLVSKDFKEYPLPPVELLEPVPLIESSESEHELTARLIEETLAQHGVEVSVAEIRPGPTVTMFGLVPGWNRSTRKTASQFQSEPKVETRNRVRVDSILAREKDLALALAAPSLRIEAPVPGESVVGVEVPNKSLQGINIRSVVESEQFKSIVQKGGLPVALGQASAGEPAAIDLLSMPHLLIAGATGSGKSVCINSVLSSLILSQQPSSVRLLLVDPKRVELTPYNGIPHLITPVIVDADRVVTFLRGAIAEMLRRYELLEMAGVRNLQSYNKSPRATEFMPYIVICIDELADLMMTSAFDVEQSICRLAQLGRATGIHMVVATQRPSVDVVTGLIKANFPSRISFAVASQVDSRTILDTSGAERLLGRGDMLFLSSDSPKPRRVQGAYVSESDTEALANYWKIIDTPDVPEIDLEYLAIKSEREGARLTNSSNSSSTHLSEGSLYEQAIDLASRERQLSTSLLQRRLRIGYPRAARLMDQLEDEGIVGPNIEPGKPRPVLYTPDLN